MEFKLLNEHFLLVFFNFSLLNVPRPKGCCDAVKCIAVMNPAGHIFQLGLYIKSRPT